MNHLGIRFAIAAIVALTSSPGLAAIRPAVVLPADHPAGMLSASPLLGKQSYSGTLQSRRHFVLTVRLHTGGLLLIDATQAYLQKRVAEPLVIGESLRVQGNLCAGILIATFVEAQRD